MNKEKNQNEAIELTDLEPVGEVNGGGDVNGDGREDIITGATVSGHIKSSSSHNSGALRNVSR